VPDGWLKAKVVRPEYAVYESRLLIRFCSNTTASQHPSWPVSLLPGSHYLAGWTYLSRDRCPIHYMWFLPSIDYQYRHPNPDNRRWCMVNIHTATYPELVRLFKPPLCCSQPVRGNWGNWGWSAMRYISGNTCAVLIWQLWHILFFNKYLNIYIFVRKK
jgi:hypothetical protein